MKFSILLFTLLFSTLVFSQDSSSSQNIVYLEGFTVDNSLDQSVLAVDGTYQFQSTSKRKINYTNEQIQLMLMRIERERRLSLDVIVVLNEYISVYIPSSQSICSPSFIPLSEFE